jgi:hypothetical protein
VVFDQLVDPKPFHTSWNWLAVQIWVLTGRAAVNSGTQTNSKPEMRTGSDRWSFDFVFIV